MESPYELSDIQQTLYTYGCFYWNLKNELAPEYRPDDRLLEDDEALDRWYHNFQAEMARKSARQSGGHRQTSTGAIPQWKPPGA